MYSFFFLCLLQLPLEVQPGKLVKLDASTLEADDYVWTSLDTDEFEIAESGRKLFFSTPKEGKYNFVLSTCRENKIQTKIWTIYVGKVEPNPEPELPDTKYNLSKVALKLAKNVPEKYEPFLPKIATNYLTLAARVNAKTIVDVKDLLQKTFVGNRRAMGLEEEGEVTDTETREKMLEVFFTPLLEAVGEANLTTIEEYAEAWVEIGTGLEKLNAKRHP